MKKYLMLMSIVLCYFATYAQDNSNDIDNDVHGGFRQENLFAGGNLALGFGSGSFNIGANPEFGYSFNKFLDAGISINLNYVSQKFYLDYDNNYDEKISGFTYGAGPFVRIFPVRFLFLQAQYEHNWTNYTDKDLQTDLRAKFHTNANSLLLGIGYAQRVVGQMSSYITLSFDALNDQYSPYLDGYGKKQPIIRAGFDFYLKPPRNKRNNYKTYGRDL